MNLLQPSRWKLALVVGLLVGWAAVRLLMDEPGPGFFVPVVLAALWFGPVGGGLAGAAATAFYAVTRGVNEDFVDTTLVAGVGVRLVVYVGGGILVGALARSLVREQSEHDLHLRELRAIQDALTPARPGEVSHIRSAVAYVPATQGVSGDFYLLTNGPRATAVAVTGDVVGKGLRASQLAWYVRTAIASAAQFTSDPAEILRLANATIFEREVDETTFVTLAVVALDPATSTVRWALAGHPPPMLLDSGIPLAAEGARGIPVGLDPASAYSSREQQIEPHGGVLLYTDGLTEARTAEEPAKQLGAERITEIVSLLVDAAPDVIVAALRDAALAHSNDVLQDDLCLVAIRKTSDSPPPPPSPREV